MLEVELIVLIFFQIFFFFSIFVHLSSYKSGYSYENFKKLSPWVRPYCFKVLILNPIFQIIVILNCEIANFKM